MAQPGDPIILDITLFDFSNSKFVKATVIADGVELLLSPFNVPNIGNGQYFFRDTINLLFPGGVFEVSIKYEIYNDAGFTQLSAVHAPAQESLLLSRAPSGGDPVIIQLLNEIKSLLLSNSLNSQLEGEVDPDTNLSGEITEVEIIGLVDDPSNIIGLIGEESELDGNIEEDSIITGDV